MNNATLNRFFALHFVLPFVLAALALMHLIALHDSAGSGNPLGVSGNYDRLPFAPYFIFKDLITIFIFILVLSMFVFFMPNLLGDSENYVMANPMQTPPAIVPEWYLLPFYAILRSIPNKLLGVIAMFSAILILLVMPLTDLSRSRGIQFKPLSKAAFFVFVGNFLILMELGAKHVESPFIEFGQISTVIYFAHFLVIVPLISLLENTLIEIDSKKFVTYYMKHATVVSGLYWWQTINITNRKLFQTDFPSTIGERLNGHMKDQLWSARGMNVYNRNLGLWVREDGMVSRDAPLPTAEHGTYKPFKWTTVERYCRDTGKSMEELKESVGIGEESLSRFLEAKRRYHQRNFTDPEYIRDIRGISGKYYLGEPDAPLDRTISTDNSYNTPWQYADPWMDPATVGPRPSNYPLTPPSPDPPSSPSAGPPSSPSAGSPSGGEPLSDASTGSSSGWTSSSERNTLSQIDAPRWQDITSELDDIISVFKDWLQSYDILFYLGVISYIVVLLLRVYLLWCNRDTIIMRISLAWLSIQLFFNEKKRIIILLGFFILSVIALVANLNVELSWVNTSVFTTISHCDAPRPWGIYFQDSATPQMEGLVELHDNILFYLVIILFGVGWLLISIVKNYTNTESPISHKYLSHGTLIELIWTITPALILILIAFPSFKLLYLMDEVSDPAMAVLAEGFFTGGLKLHILNKIK